MNLVAGALNSHSKEHGHAMTTQQAAESGHLVAGTLQASDGGMAAPERVGELVPTIARSVTTREGQRMGCEQDIAHALTARHDSSEDGCGRGTPIIPFDTTQITSSSNYSNPQEGDPMHPLANGQHAPAIAYQCHGSNVGPMGTLREGNGNETGGVPFTITGTDKTQRVAIETDVAGSIRTKPPGSQENSSTTVALQRSRVRRLTPRECERLQGFPDDWTRWGHDGRELSDSARYRMLGNAVTVNVAEWIGQRIVAAHNTGPAER